MIIKGIERGDQKFRHFTFDDQDFVTKNGVQYYKVNYGKNKLEGDDAEDEIGYVSTDNIICLGGKKLTRNIPQRNQVETNVVHEQTEIEPVQRKRGRPRKNEIPETENQIQTTHQNVGTFDIFEYDVREFKKFDINTLKDELNEYGANGWELCGLNIEKNMFGDNTFALVIFKRKRG